MSIKGFHLIFIVVAIMTTAGFGMWALKNYVNPITSVGAFSIALALSIYFGYFIRTLSKKI